jgi:hypothetical protein
MDAGEALEIVAVGMPLAPDAVAVGVAPSLRRVLAVVLEVVAAGTLLPRPAARVAECLALSVVLRIDGPSRFSKCFHSR